mgnify:FL=1
MALSLPKVTIIIPVYNAGPSINRCIESILAQTNKSFHVLLINDGSSDDSLERIQQAEKDNPTLFTALTQNNQGVCATRHRGIQESNTEYIMFVDNDDYLDPDYVDVLLSNIEHNNSDLVISGYRRTTEKKVLFEVHAPDNAYTPYKITAPWAKIYRRDLLLNEEVRFLETNLGEDILFSLAAYKHAKSIQCVDYIGYNWYSNSCSVSNTKQQGLKAECDPQILLNSLNDLYPIKSERPALFVYFIVRYVVWYLLFSGRTATRARFTQVADSLFAWLDKNGYRLNFHFYNNEISTESLINRVAVSTLYGLSRFHLIPLFARLYCKGRPARNTTGR